MPKENKYRNGIDDKPLTAEERIWLGRLNRVGIGYFRPIVAVSLIPGTGITSDERIEFFKAVERFIFINFRMAMYQSSYKSSDYYRKTREVYRKECSLGDVTADLNATTDQNAQDAVRVFVTRMNRRFISADGFYSWRDLRYFLFEYEYTLAEKHKIEKLDWAVLTKVVKDRITVEHILPQTPTVFYWRNQSIGAISSVSIPQKKSKRCPPPWAICCRSRRASTPAFRMTASMIKRPVGTSTEPIAKSRYRRKKRGTLIASMNEA